MKSAPRRFRCLLVAWGCCCFPFAWGGNDPLLPRSGLTAMAMKLPTSGAKAGRKPRNLVRRARVTSRPRANRPTAAPLSQQPPRKASRFAFEPSPVGKAPTHGKVPHAAFVVYLRRGAAAIPPFCLGAETNPFYPRTVPAAVATEPLTYGIRAGRKPTFRLRFVRALFRLRANRPAEDVLL